MIRNDHFEEKELDLKKILMFKTLKNLVKDELKVYLVEEKY
ncbi:MAG: hypothetical protein CM15mP22_7940 [Gammaproteobacteria bacterium]|nr:MAG: hypothetical protein CM15mP22_7940 [Gammaproteobacteria bacterium]